MRSPLGHFDLLVECHVVEFVKHSLAEDWMEVEEGVADSVRELECLERTHFVWLTQHLNHWRSQGHEADLEWKMMNRCLVVADLSWGLEAAGLLLRVDWVWKAQLFLTVMRF